ncbi:MAG TPA: NADPH-dependent FMN reductase [Rhizomicrobium sp.]|nr:NADPH-dependent FMN reductase [Rhizomicrobium sp.]
MRLLAISGSLRAASSNTTLLKAAQLVAPQGMEIELYDGLGSLPHFNSDLDVEPLPPTVADLRARIAAADGLLISSPEYARGVPGSLKNAFDWLVSGPEFPEKPIAFFNASDRSLNAQTALRLTLETMSGRMVDEAMVTVRLLGKMQTAEEIANDPEIAGMLRVALVAFAKVVVK